MAAPRSHAGASYSVLLLQKLLSLRDGISPLTLVLDTVRESGVPLVEEMMLRAKTATAAAGGPRTTEPARVVYAASHLAPRRRSPHVDVYVERRGQPLEAFRQAILAAVATQAAQTTPHGPPARVLVVVDALSQVARQDPLHAAAFVASLVAPTVAVVGLYHTDDAAGAAGAVMPGASALHRGKPHPFRVLCHLATAVLRVQPLHEEVARKRARDRAAEAPRFGWAAGEGWPYGHSAAARRHGSRRALVGGLARGGLLVTMELRRRSGRAVVEQYVVVLGSSKKASSSAASASTAPRGAFPWERGAVPCADITVLADHALFAAARDPGEDRAAGGDDHEGEEEEEKGGGGPTSTFNLGLTDKQRRDRAGIVLPYFDAQTDIGAGEGGRILYDMGREDDFDDEEDEI